MNPCLNPLNHLNYIKGFKHILFCLVAFFLIANCSPVYANAIVTQVNIDGVEANWVELKKHGLINYDNLSRQSGLPEKLRINGVVKSISFIYDLDTDDESLFQCKLDAIDNEWSIATNDRIITYHNLTPGNYIFYVRPVLKGAAGVSTTFEFNIIAPFWESKPFTFILIVALILNVVSV